MSAATTHAVLGAAARAGDELGALPDTLIHGISMEPTSQDWR